jgi:hypothetical protein
MWVIRSIRFFFHLDLRSGHETVSPCPRTRPTERQEVVGEDAETHPPLHPQEAAIATASEAVAPFQGADASFRAGPPSEGGSNATGAGFPVLSRQDHGPHATLARELFIGARSESPIGDRQPGRSAEELHMPGQRRRPQGPIGHPHGADRIVRDELRLGFLDLHQGAELRGFGGLALADGFRVGFEEAEHFIGVVNVAAQHPGPRLGHHPSNQVAGGSQLGAEGCTAGVDWKRLTRSVRSACRRTTFVIRSSPW